MDTAVKHWREISELLDSAGLNELAAYIRAESVAAHAAPLSIPVVGETGSGKSALIARIFGEDSATSFPQDVLESTARSVEVKYAPRNYRAVVGAAGESEECGDDSTWDLLVRGRKPVGKEARLEVGLRCEDLSTWNASLVDTPGVNTSTPELEGRTWAVAATAPVVIYAIPATSAGRKTDIDYLESVRDNSSSVVVVLTKVDQLPRDSVARVVAEFENRLAEVGIAPMAILPTASTTNVGICALRRTLTEATGRRRAQLVSRHLGGRVAEQIHAELADVLLKQAALTAKASTIGSEARAKERDIVELAADEESDISGAASLLKVRCRRLRATAFNRMHSISEDTLRSISDEIHTLQSRDEVQTFAQGPVRNTVLRWREECVAVAEHHMRELDQARVEKAQAVAFQQLKSEGVSLDWLEDLPKGGTVKPAIGEGAEIEYLHRCRTELLAEIEDLQKGELTKDKELKDVQDALNVVRERRKALVYRPQMDKVVVNQGTEIFQKAGRVLGKVAGVILTLATKKASPVWLTRAADLSLLGERLGEMIGGSLVSDRVEETENEGVRQEFLRSRKAHDDEIARLVNEREDIRLRQEQVEHALREKHGQVHNVEQDVERLKREARELETLRENVVREEDASRAKTALMAQLSRQLLARDGESLFAEIRGAVGAGFDAAYEAIVERLEERVRAIKSDVQAAVKEAREKQAQGESAVKEALDGNRRMCGALRSALSSLEAL